MTGIKNVAVIAGFVNPSSYIRQKNLRKNPGAVGVSGKPRPVVQRPTKQKKPGNAALP
jgi:hypothetical protein